MSKFSIFIRKMAVVNTDPQRRCYDGCNFSEELQWGPWEEIDFDIAKEKLQERLKYWRGLNDYAVSQRGESARCEFLVGLSHETT